MTLSARQLQCLQFIAEGKSSQEIAEVLGLSVRTVDHYVGAACQKLGARSRAQAVAAAFHMALIHPETRSGVALAPGGGPRRRKPPVG